MARTVEYRIHPSVGIARMGDSDTVFFIGPETVTLGSRSKPVLMGIPGKPAPALPGAAGADGHRDAAGKLAKQAARFRVFAYTYETGIGGRRADFPVDVKEVTDAEYVIEWKVTVGNTKSFADATQWGTKLPNVSQEVVLKTGPAAPAGTLPLQNLLGNRLQLGSAALGAGGSLLVLGSDGKSQRIAGVAELKTGLFWQGWEDDAADGPVKATVTRKADNKTAEARSAWVVIGPPAFAPDIRPPVTLYDRAYSLALANGGRLRPDFDQAQTSTERDILPLLHSYVAMGWVSQRASEHHLRQTVDFRQIDPASVAAFLRQPMPDDYVAESMDYPNVVSPPKGRDGVPIPGVGTIVSNNPQRIDEAPLMPKVYFLALMSAQMRRIRDAISGPQPAEDVKPFEETNLSLPFILDYAAMSSMTGGSFCPGIEVCNAAADMRKWQADYGSLQGHVDLRFALTPPVVVPLSPGTLTGKLAVPWQVDFFDCGDDWWPHARPNTIVVGTKDANGQFVRYSWTVKARVRGGVEMTAEDFRNRWAEMGIVRKQTAAADGFWEEERTFF